MTTPEAAFSPRWNTALSPRIHNLPAPSSGSSRFRRHRIRIWNAWRRASVRSQVFGCAFTARTIFSMPRFRLRLTPSKILRIKPPHRDAPQPQNGTYPMRRFSEILMNMTIYVIPSRHISALMLVQAANRNRTGVSGGFRAVGGHFGTVKLCHTI